MFALRGVRCTRGLLVVAGVVVGVALPASANAKVTSLYLFAWTTAFTAYDAAGQPPGPNTPLTQGDRFEVHHAIYTGSPRSDLGVATVHGDKVIGSWTLRSVFMRIDGAECESRLSVADSSLTGDSVIVFNNLDPLGEPGFFATRGTGSFENFTGAFVSPITQNSTNSGYYVAVYLETA
jgi:hypothetical protein